jgi:hypothetical protein
MSKKSKKEKQLRDADGVPLPVDRGDSADERDEFIKMGGNPDLPPSSESADQWISGTSLLDPHMLSFDRFMKHGQSRMLGRNHIERLLQSYAGRPPSESAPLKALAWQSDGMVAYPNI